MPFTSPSRPSVHVLVAFAALLAFANAGSGYECSTIVHKDPQVTWQSTKCNPGPVFTKVNDTIFVNYNGTFLNGTQFDSSYTPEKPWPLGDPFNFTLGAHEVIKGFDAGLYNMFPGEIRRLTIAPEFAYGPKGTRDGSIPPNSTLNFSVELMRIGSVANKTRFRY